MPPVPILLITRELDIGGCERDLTKLALGFDRSRFEPHVGSFRPCGLRAEELRRAGVPILHLEVESFLSSSLLRGAWQMHRYVKDHGIKLVHALDVPGDIFASLVGTVSRSSILLTSQLGARDLYDRRTHRLLRITDRLTDAVLVNSDALRKYLIEREGVPGSRIRVCYNGVDRHDFHPADGEARRRDVLPESFRDASLVVGTVAALRPEKNLPTLIKAFAALRPQHENLRLAVVGSGVMRDAWLDLAQELGLGDICHFEPTTSAVGDWMRAMDVFVLPSLSESFSNSLLEAMACGCCPIASRVGGLPEMIVEGESGLLFEPGNAKELAAKLRLVVDGAGARRRLAAGAARRAHETFSVDVFVKRTEGIYQALLDGNRQT